VQSLHRVSVHSVQSLDRVSVHSVQSLDRVSVHSVQSLHRVRTLGSKLAQSLRTLGSWFDAVHALLPLLAQLFLLSFESARVPADWKDAKITPLYKKGPMLDPNSYRMLAVSGTMDRLYANVIRSLLTTWCISKSKILDTQFGFYPGRNTQQPMFIHRHLQHAARTIKPSNSSRLHTAFIVNKPMTLSSGRLFGHISVAYARLQLSFLLFKACMLVTSTSYKTGIKLHRLSLLWV